MPIHTDRERSALAGARQHRRDPGGSPNGWPTRWRYHTNAIGTVEMLQALIDLARDLRPAHRRGEEEGLKPKEITFYDALAENESAVDVLGDDRLKVAAQKLSPS